MCIMLYYVCYVLMRPSSNRSCRGKFRTTNHQCVGERAKYPISSTEWYVVCKLSPRASNSAYYSMQYAACSMQYAVCRASSAPYLTRSLFVTYLLHKQVHCRDFQSCQLDQSSLIRIQVMRPSGIDGPRCGSAAKLSYDRPGVTPSLLFCRLSSSSGFPSWPTGQQANRRRQQRPRRPRRPRKV